jgi:OmcA/MtrC family decaheme c-type cytochrome
VSVPAPNVAKLATGVTGNAARRAIVTNAKCNDCHAALGVFTAAVYHAAQRNDAPTCTFCHNVNRVNSGWGVNIKEAVHAIHAGAKREKKFSWEATAGGQYWNITYPAILNNCEACHVPGSYDFSASGNAAAMPNLLWTTVATGTPATTAYSIVTGAETVLSTDSVISPWINPAINTSALPLGTAYGAGFGYNAGTQVITPAVGTTLVASPITSACSACHDSKVAIAHMTGNGGAFYEARTTALAKVEQCMICHGNGKTADIRAVHMTWK